jgi:L-amino acid N-acyltransferase YncA
MQDYVIRRVAGTDREAVMDVFNYFVENSFAAYPDKKAGYSVFDFLRAMSREDLFYVIVDPEGQVIGFGMLRHHQRADAFNRSAEVTYFILPGHQGKGLGKRMLDTLVDDARRLGVDTILANISSLNEQSLKFHSKNGFIECGRFVRIGSKFGRDFDVVWMQRFLD